MKSHVDAKTLGYFHLFHDNDMIPITGDITLCYMTGENPVS